MQFEGFQKKEKTSQVALMALVALALTAALALCACSSTSSSDSSSSSTGSSSTENAAASSSVSTERKPLRTATFALRSMTQNPGTWTYTMKPEGAFKEISHTTEQLRADEDDTIEDIFVFEAQKSTEEAVVVFTLDSTGETAEFSLEIESDMNILNNYMDGSAWYLNLPDIS